MRQVRNGEAFASGMTATGFWLGITVGRVVLGFVTPRIGEKIAIVVRHTSYNSRIPTNSGQIYSLLAIGLGLILWLVPNFYSSAGAVSLQGFFLGPFFPAVVVVATKLLPKSLHVSAIGFAAAFGGGGAAVLPFAVGAIAQARGVDVLQPLIIGLSAGILLLWLGLPRVPKKGEEGSRLSA
jgi:fucose permease